MIKAAFFVKNKSLFGVDCSNLSQGNPGIGGSEYIILSVAYYLSIGDNGIEITLFVQQNNLLPKGMNVIVSKDLKEAILECDKMKIDTLAFRHDTCWIEDGTFVKSPLFVKLIPWCHNFVHPRILSFYARNDFFVRILTVGKEQLELYIDHIAYNKSDYIFNGINLLPYTILRKKMLPFVQRGNVVTYIGSLIPSKGFHILAKAWPNVIRKCPDAQLYVIGSGLLYDRKVVMGKYGLAEDHYESKFIKYLIKDGEILSSVHFLGLLGVEKNEILKKTKVGIPNPSGFTETFGISAVEMQLMGAVIATIRCPGFLDTVRDKRFLYDNPKQLSSFILKALQINDYDENETFNWLKQKFDISTIIIQWADLLINKIPKGGWLHVDRYNYENLDFECKSLKIVLSNFKKNIPGINLIPTIESIKEKVYQRIKR